MDTGQRLAGMTLKTMPVYGFDHSPARGAKVRNVSRLGSQILSTTYELIVDLFDPSISRLWGVCFNLTIIPEYWRVVLNRNRGIGQLFRRQIRGRLVGRRRHHRIPPRGFPCGQHDCRGQKLCKRKSLVLASTFSRTARSGSKRAISTAPIMVEKIAKKARSLSALRWPGMNGNIRLL